MSGSSDYSEPESETGSDLKNNLPLEDSIISVTDNEISDIEENEATEYQADQTDNVEVNNLLDWILSSDRFIPRQNRTKTLPRMQYVCKDCFISYHVLYRFVPTHQKNRSWNSDAHVK